MSRRRTQGHGLPERLVVQLGLGTRNKGELSSRVSLRVVAGDQYTVVTDRDAPREGTTDDA